MDKIRVSKVDDVTLWRRGVRFEGILHLAQHHIVFSYIPPPTDTADPHAPPPKPKELWITYPMISFCTYRPAPAASRQQPSIRIRCRDFTFAAFHFVAEAKARDVYETIRNLTCKLGRLDKLYAFSYQPQGPEKQVNGWKLYDPTQEWRRMGVGSKGSSNGWRISNINTDYGYCPTYPKLLAVPSTISDNVLNYAGRHRSRVRIPVLTYLHPMNDCSISRCAQPLVGVRGNRSVQDEKLVAAIFATSKTAPPESAEVDTGAEYVDDQLSRQSADASSQDLDELEDEAIAQTGHKKSSSSDEVDEPRIYGSQQHNLIVDARPTVNALAMQAIGMGSENMDHYPFATKAYLGIDNIHVMRDSLQKVIDALKESDVTPLPPNRELLEKSGWLKHISKVLDGTALIARQVAIHHSHVLLHCSDGWDRTSQLAALSQLCLDPYYRTIEGFIVLVEKDFLSFGHMFRHRSGPLSSEKWFDIENDRVGGIGSPRSISGSGDNSGGAFSGAKAQKTFENAFLSAKGFFNKHTAGGSTSHANESRESLNDEMSSYDPAGTSSPSRAASNATGPASMHASLARNEDTATATPPTKPKETSPIFHQFLDATYQLQQQHPTRFEYNERFLRRLLYHLYSCQYGTFLFDNELQRVEARVTERTRSVWDYFLARKEQFVNPEWDGGEAVVDDSVRGKERLLLPIRGRVRWWAEVFGRADDEMNGPAFGAAPASVGKSASSHQMYSSNGTSTVGSSGTFTPPTLSTATSSASATGDGLYGSALEAVETADGGMQVPSVVVADSSPAVESKGDGPALHNPRQRLMSVMLDRDTDDDTAGAEADNGESEDEDGDPLGVSRMNRRAERSEQEQSSRGTATQEIAAGLAGIGIGVDADAKGDAYQAQTRIGKGVEMELQ